MNINESNQPKDGVSKSEQAHAVEAWWHSLSREEKEFNFELGQFVRDLQAGKFKVDSGTHEKMQQGLRKVIKKLDASCNDVGLKVLGGDPEQFRWN